MCGSVAFRMLVHMWLADAVMPSNVSSSSQVRASSADIDSIPAARLRDATWGKAFVERVIFWLFVAALAWTPFWYGSNDLVAWGINAVLFPGLAARFES